MAVDPGDPAIPGSATLYVVRSSSAGTTSYATYSYADICR